MHNYFQDGEEAGKGVSVTQDLLRLPKKGGNVVDNDGWWPQQVSSSMHFDRAMAELYYLSAAAF